MCKAQDSALEVNVPRKTIEGHALDMARIAAERASMWGINVDTDEWALAFQWERRALKERIELACIE